VAAGAKPARKSPKACPYSFRSGAAGAGLEETADEIDEEVIAPARDQLSGVAALFGGVQRAVEVWRDTSPNRRADQASAPTPARRPGSPAGGRPPRARGRRGFAHPGSSG
jgi:hypothetical protein